MATKRAVWQAIQHSGDDVLIAFIREAGQTFGLDRVEFGGLVWERDDDRNAHD